MRKNRTGRRNRAQRRKARTELPIAEIAKIECVLAKWATELGESELKLADYVRLADIDSLADEGGGGDLVIRWVSQRPEQDRDG